MKLNRGQAEKIVEQMRSEIVRPECRTCDCFQGLLTQIELDCTEDISDITNPLKAPKGKMVRRGAAKQMDELLGKIQGKF